LLGGWKPDSSGENRKSLRSAVPPSMGFQVHGHWKWRPSPRGPGLCQCREWGERDRLEGHLGAWRCLARCGG
jgi:hypothetical protein